MALLFLIFVALPLVDIWLLLAIGDVIGFWPTVGITISTALIGGYLGKREGSKVLAQWRQAMSELRMPEDGLVSASLVLAGSVLLVTPGVITDTIGILFLIPFTRRPIARVVRQRFEGRMKRAVQSGNLRVSVSVQDPQSWSVARDVDVIDVEGEVVPDAPKLLGPGSHDADRSRPPTVET